MADDAGMGADGAFVGLSPAGHRRSPPVPIPMSQRPVPPPPPPTSSPSSFVPGSVPTHPSGSSPFLGTSPVSATSVPRRSATRRSDPAPSMKTATYPRDPLHQTRPGEQHEALEDALARSLANSARLARPPAPPVLVATPEERRRRMVYVPALSRNARAPSAPPAAAPAFEDAIRAVEPRLGYLGPISRNKVVHVFDRVYHNTSLRCFNEALRLALMMADIHMDCDAIVAAILYGSALPHEHLRDIVDPPVLQILRENASFSRALESASIDPAPPLPNDDNLNAAPDTHHKLRRLVIGTATDWRAIALELFATVWRWNARRDDPTATPSEKDRLAQRILTVYAPLANQLGMWCIQSELEELAFEHLHPQECRTLRQLVGERLETCAAAIENAKLSIERALCADPDLRRFVKSVCIRGRIKGIYSIHKKMNRSGKRFEEILDLVGLRVRVEPRWDNIGERDEYENRCCYKMLDLVHSIWEPQPSRVKDFLERPKENGYSSLHTTVTTEAGVPLEIQIRTERMHARAEFGRAAHWAYKDASYLPPFKTIARTPRDEFALKGADSFHLTMPDKSGVDDHVLDQELSLFKTHAEFMSFQNREIRKHHVMVLSEGEVHELIPGSTILDLAFNRLGMTHSEVVAATRQGSRPTVNGVVVPLTHKLSMSDIVGFSRVDDYDDRVRRADDSDDDDDDARP